MQASTSPIWSKTNAENIVRHRSGTLYLNAKIGGRKVRESLKTENMKEAKAARDEKLKEYRSTLGRGSSSIATIGDALAVVETKVRGTVDLKESTREFYRHLLIGVKRSLPVGLPGSAWTSDAAARWWGEFAAANSPTHSNNALRIVKMMAEELRKAGHLREDVMANLSRKRNNDKAVKRLPSPEQFDMIVADIRKQRKATSEESADLCEFLAWSGLRKGEVCHVEWEHLDEKWLTVTGGKLLTKNRKVRRVPINKRLRAVIKSRRYDGATGPIFSLREPRESLTAACKRQKMAHLRVHDLRHLFATWAIESGVDIPTVAKWLGHRDGGILAMKTYGHLRDEHSLSAAEKLG